MVKYEVHPVTALSLIKKKFNVPFKIQLDNTCSLSKPKGVHFLALVICGTPVLGKLPGKHCISGKQLKALKLYKVGLVYKAWKVCTTLINVINYADLEITLGVELTLAFAFILCLITLFKVQIGDVGLS